MTAPAELSFRRDAHFPRENCFFPNGIAPQKTMLLEEIQG
jgi:hypothetical protein